jgi:hypothetical protein
MSKSAPSSRFGPYKNALNAISLRTGTPLPSLLVSFAVLHELTAIVPLVGIFYGARTLGVGERIVNEILHESPGESGWVREKCRDWVAEGERWARRVGNRYAIFGLQKAPRPSQPTDMEDDHLQEGQNLRQSSGQIAGDVANAVVAYGVTKA